MRVLLLLGRLLASLDLQLIAHVFQPFVMWVYKYTGVGNYTIAKHLLTASCALFFGVGVAYVLVLAIIIPQVIGILPCIVSAIFSHFLLKFARGFRGLARILERDHVRMQASGKLHDLTDHRHPIAVVRIALLGWLLVTLLLDASAIFAIALLTGRLIISLLDMIYLVALMLLCAGSYLTSCKHPPPHARRQPAPGRVAFAWN